MATASLTPGCTTATSRNTVGTVFVVGALGLALSAHTRSRWRGLVIARQAHLNAGH
ncbi:hypothetical protein ABT255_35415 [Streptomyces mirabilis]|uniref:hypothetical protein n=1 Tax=Streptomyces mirabilis TaxID=68239 RepID=UPI00332F420D